jgi:fatty-acid desaturase
VDWIFNFAILLTLGIIKDEYRAVHLEHHEFTDEEGDPHSPADKGVLAVVLKNVMYYREAKNDPALRAKWNVGENDGWWDKHLFNSGIVGPIVGTTALCSAYAWWLGLPGAICALSSATLHGSGYIFLSGCINGLCHWKGEKNFDNTATNRRILALLTGGEGWHNNHHGFPTSPKLGYKPNEFDEGWLLTKALKKLRLAKTLPTIEERITLRQPANAT